MPFLVAIIAELTHSLYNNRSSVGMIGCKRQYKINITGVIDIIIRAAQKRHDNPAAAALTPTVVSYRGGRFVVFPVGVVFYTR